MLNEYDQGYPVASTGEDDATTAKELKSWERFLVPRTMRKWGMSRFHRCPTELVSDSARQGGVDSPFQNDVLLDPCHNPELI